MSISQLVTDENFFISSVQTSEICGKFASREALRPASGQAKKRISPGASFRPFSAVRHPVDFLLSSV